MAFLRSLLHARLMKALWEALRCPGFVDRYLPKLQDLLLHLLAAASQPTGVPLNASIEALAARSIALCAMLPDRIPPGSAGQVNK